MTWPTIIEPVPAPPGESDTRAFGEGWAVVTPFRFDWTAREWLTRLSQWTGDSGVPDVEFAVARRLEYFGSQVPGAA